MKDLISFFRSCIITILSITYIISCKEKVNVISTGQSHEIINLDTAKVEEALRRFSALPPGTRGKARILDTIRQEAIKMGYNEQACYLSMDLARGQSDRGNLDSALYYYNQAKPYCDKPLFDKTLPAAFLAEFGAFYHSLRSDYVAANESYYNALNYLKANDLTDTELAITLYLFLHGTQMKLGHQDQAFLYLKEGEQLAEKLDSKQGLAASWAYLGDYYANIDNDSLALNYYDRNIEYEKYIWDPNILTTALLGKADVLIKTGNAELAIPVLEKALDVAHKEVVHYTTVAATIGLGDAYNKLGRYRETIQKVTPLLDVREFNTVNEKGYKVLMDAYEGLGDYKKALEQQRKLYEWRDSIINVEKTSALHELELKFQTASKDKEIASRGLLIEQQKNKISHQNALIAGISAAAMLALLVLVVLYKNAAHKRNVKELEIKTLRRQQEIDLLKSTMQGEEQERQRLARELHDGIGSMISSAIMRLSLLKKSQRDDPENYKEVLHLLQETGSEVRKTAYNLMPDTIYKQSISDAVKTYCESITSGSPLEIDVQFYGVNDEFTPHCKLVIYRIIQELVHNIVKHSQANHAIVQGVMNKDRFNITVEDNGRGFDTIAGKRGMGLKNVESRVKSLCGEFQVDSTPGKGTTVYIEFDCSQIMMNRET